VLYQRGTPAGYFELCRHPEDGNSVELKYFGLLPSFVGQGLGRAIVQAAIAQAQRWSTGRVWLHTCSDDHPAALSTYQKAGFVLIQTETAPSEVPLDYATALLDAPYVQSRLARFKQN
jgi:GNAT superfamily N-acetyltransferase